MTISQTLGCLFIFFSAISCQQQPAPPTESTTDSTINKEFFPVYDFLKTEIRTVDSLPVGLKYYIVTNGKSDSGYIATADFDKLAVLFTPDALKPTALKENFKETSFYDRSTKTSTFMYQPINSNTPVRRVDILTRATDTYDKVSSIYIEYLLSSADSSVLNKLMWTTGRSMQINQQVTRAGSPDVVRQTKVVWNNWDETP